MNLGIDEREEFFAMFILKPAGVRAWNGRSGGCRLQGDVDMWSQSWEPGPHLTRISRDQQQSNSRGQTLPAAALVLD